MDSSLEANADPFERNERSEASRTRDTNGATTCAWPGCLASTGRPSWTERCQRKEAYCKSHCLDMGHCDIECRRHYDMLNAKEKEYVRIWAEQSSDGRPPPLRFDTGTSPPATINTRKRAKAVAAANIKRASKPAQDELSPAILQSLAEKLAPIIVQAMQNSTSNSTQVKNTGKDGRNKRASSSAAGSIKAKKARKEAIESDQSDFEEDDSGFELGNSEHCELASSGDDDDDEDDDVDSMMS